ncbi:tetratricopeptide repeat protein [Microcoleus sp. FACHB-SPT15]|uniref:tetratricopeptide repeat protein n=1 Tax=Microcoleus sp. FACHB-SPT15 TaxID=2692830 RepID=UPI00177A8AC6|nr:tetratricopeptide repeat protein [Microcoleus sp. FACHB-SPT15]MBD1804244.1 tetratricopeptide repeat protein [Microcoleus sp. FACHB-SPT15]
MRKQKKSLLVPFALCFLPVVIPTTAFSTSMQPSLISPPSLPGKGAGGLGSTAASPPTVFAQTSENPETEAEKYLAQGVEQLDANQFEAAFESFQQVLAIQRQKGERFGEAIALNNLGIVHYYQGEYEQAIAFQQESMQIFWDIYGASNNTDSASRSGIAVTLNNQSIAYRQLGQHQKAIELCHGAIGIFRNMADRTREAAALNNIGVAYEAIGEYQRAIGYFQEALSTVQGNSDARGEVITLSNIGEAYSKLGQSDQAVKFEQQANVIAQKIGEDVGIGGAASSNDYLLVRENKRALAIVFSPPKATPESP